MTATSCFIDKCAPWSPEGYLCCVNYSIWQCYMLYCRCGLSISEHATEKIIIITIIIKRVNNNSYTEQDIYQVFFRTNQWNSAQKVEEENAAAGKPLGCVCGVFSLL